MTQESLQLSEQDFLNPKNGFVEVHQFGEGSYIVMTDKGLEQAIQQLRITIDNDFFTPYQAGDTNNDEVHGVIASSMPAINDLFIEASQYAKFINDTGENKTSTYQLFNADGIVAARGLHEAHHTGEKWAICLDDAIASQAKEEEYEVIQLQSNFQVTEEDNEVNAKVYRTSELILFNALFNPTKLSDLCEKIINKNLVLTTYALDERTHAAIQYLVQNSSDPNKKIVIDANNPENANRINRKTALAPNVIDSQPVRVAQGQMDNPSAWLQAENALFELGKELGENLLRVPGYAVHFPENYDTIKSEVVKRQLFNEYLQKIRLAHLFLNGRHHITKFCQKIDIGSDGNGIQPGIEFMPVFDFGDHEESLQKFYELATLDSLDSEEFSQWLKTANIFDNEKVQEEFSEYAKGGDQEQNGHNLIIHLLEEGKVSVDQIRAKLRDLIKDEYVWVHHATECFKDRKGMVIEAHVNYKKVQINGVNFECTFSVHGVAGQTTETIAVQLKQGKEWRGNLIVTKEEAIDLGILSEEQFNKMITAHKEKHAYLLTQGITRYGDDYGVGEIETTTGTKPVVCIQDINNRTTGCHPTRKLEQKYPTQQAASKLMSPIKPIELSILQNLIQTQFPELGYEVIVNGTGALMIGVLGSSATDALKNLLDLQSYLERQNIIREEKEFHQQEA